MRLKTQSTNKRVNFSGLGLFGLNPVSVTLCVSRVVLLPVLHVFHPLLCHWMFLVNQSLSTLSPSCIQSAARLPCSAVPSCLISSVVTFGRYPVRTFAQPTFHSFLPVRFSSVSSRFV